MWKLRILLIFLLILIYIIKKEFFINKFLLTRFGKRQLCFKVRCYTLDTHNLSRKHHFRFLFWSEKDAYETVRSSIAAWLSHGIHLCVNHVRSEGFVLYVNGCFLTRLVCEELFLWMWKAFLVECERRIKNLPVFIQTAISGQMLRMVVQMKITF